MEYYDNIDKLIARSKLDVEVNIPCITFIYMILSHRTIKYIDIYKQTPLAPQFGVICIMGYIVQNRYVVLS